MKMNKKGQLEQMQGLVIGLVTVALVLAIGFLIMGSVRDQAQTIEANSTAVNATEATMQAIDDIPGWLPIIVITVIGAILLGLVSMFRKRF